MAEYDYDLFVIGGGSGGVRAGRVASSMGKRVGIAEEFRYGGTCVIRGCVPKKLLVYASQYSKTLKDAAGYGWSVGASSFDWSKLRDAKDAEITRLEGLYRKGLSNAEADIYDQRAIVKDANTIVLADGNELTAERILIAVGGRPNPMADLPGSEYGINSDTVFDLAKLPKSMVVLGAGYIALEFACIFANMGTKVSVVYRGDEILRGFDNDVRAHLREEMQKNENIEFILETNINSITLDGDTRKVTLTNGTTIDADQVLLAAGRIANTDTLGLNSAGVEMDKAGNVIVDDYSRTNVPSILAVGDVTNRINLTPVAIHESMCLIETEYKNNPTKPDHELVPTAVFTQPEIGTVGLSEEDAAKQFDEVHVFKASFRPMKNILPGREEKMLMKTIVDAKTDRVVGVHIVGPESGEMSQLLGISLKIGATKADFDKTMAVHPTAAEELVTSYSPSYVLKNGKRIT